MPEVERYSDDELNRLLHLFDQYLDRTKRLSKDLKTFKRKRFLVLVSYSTLLFVGFSSSYYMTELYSELGMIKYLMIFLSSLSPFLFYLSFSKNKPHYNLMNELWTSQVNLQNLASFFSQYNEHNDLSTFKKDEITLKIRETRKVIRSLRSRYGNFNRSEISATAILPEDSFKPRTAIKTESSTQYESVKKVDA